MLVKFIITDDLKDGVSSDIAGKVEGEDVDYIELPYTPQIGYTMNLSDWQEKFNLTDDDIEKLDQLTAKVYTHSSPPSFIIQSVDMHIDHLEIFLTRTYKFPIK